MDVKICSNNPKADENLKPLGINGKEFQAIGLLAKEIIYHFTGKQCPQGLQEVAWLVPKLAKLIRDHK